MKRHSPETRARLVEAVQEKMTTDNCGYSAAAKALGVSPGSYIKWRNDSQATTRAKVVIHQPKTIAAASTLKKTRKTSTTDQKRCFVIVVPSIDQLNAVLENLK
jgi:transposase-like protein